MRKNLYINSLSKFNTISKTQIEQKAYEDILRENR